MSCPPCAIPEHVPALKKEAATVAGNVLRLDTGEPLKKAKVILVGSEANALYVFYLTDELGHFLFENVPQGSYHLQILRNGYVEAAYGQKKLGAPGAILTLASGQRVTDLIFKLARTAAISGHVFDEDGEPVSKAEITAYRVSKREGQERPNDYDPVLANDLGEFRIFDLVPGRYYLAVNFRNEDAMHPAAAVARQKLDTGYLTTYYPNTTDPTKAQAISVAAGDEIRSVDFLLRASHLVTVSGRVINMVPATSEALGSVSLNPRESGLAQAVRGLQDNFKLKDGNFIIHDVPPGSYFLTASWMGRESIDERHMARRPLDVGNSDMEGVTITISRGIDIKGHVTWEGTPPGDPQYLQVSLHPVEEDQNGIPSQMVKQDGTFQFRDVPDGAYRPVVFLGGLAENFYLKSARYGSASISDADFVFQPRPDASLELTMSSHAATLTGIVLTTDSLAAVGASVVLIPDPSHRNIKERYKSVTTDQNGKFFISGIAPGDYKLFSWDSVEEVGWYDADWYDPNG